MKRKLQFLKTLLVAVGLCAGASEVWADVPTYTWDFTNTTTWTTAKIATGSAVTLNPSAATPGAGEYGVTFNFTSETGAIIGYNAASKSVTGTGLWYGTNGSSTAENISITIPNGFKVTLTMICGNFAGRPFGSTNDGGKTTTNISASPYEYTNDTGSDVTLVVWATNAVDGSSRKQNCIQSIVLEDFSSASSYSWSAKAVIKNTSTQIDSWAGAEYLEGETYNVWAKKVIIHEGKYYELDDAKFAANAITFSTTMGSSNIEHEISYKLSDDIVYYAEGEALNSTQERESLLASGGKYTYYYHGNFIVDIDNVGVYKMETNVLDRGNQVLAVYESDGETVLASLSNPGTGYKATPNFLVSESSVKIGQTESNNTLSFDYVLIRKVADVTDPSKIIGAVDYTTAENGASSSDIVLKDGDAYRITFQNHGSAAANKNHFIVNVSNGGSKKASLYADWYDYTNDKGGWGYYFSNPYSANGGTSGNSVDWGTFATEMQDIPVTLNITYQNGKVNIIGTAPKNTNTYYWNYSYGKGVDGATDLTGDVTINLSVCLAWLEILSVEQTAVGATLGTNGYTTFASTYPLDLTTANLPAGVKAYKAAVDGTVVRFTELNQTVPANTGILLEGTANATVTIPVVASGSAVSENAFLVNTTAATITSDASTYYFAMVKDSNPLKFGKVNGVVIPTNKAYLEVPATNFTTPAPSLTAIFDDGNTTGINTVKNAQLMENGEYYNLAGQRVAQPTKGLYIVNGRKVVVK